MGKRLTSITVITLLFAVSSVYPQGVGRSRPLTFEGTLIAYSSHSGIACGVLYVHQVARYRVDKILMGKYGGNEIVIDHPACEGDVFKDIPVGSRVKITARVWRKYLAVTMHPGIREEENPKIFYVAQVPPAKMKLEK